MQSTPMLDRTETLSSPINNTDQFNRPLKRSYTSSPLRSTTSNSSLSRTSSFLSEVDEEGGTRWTRQHWKKLEEYYIKKDRDIEKATSAFYYCESLIRVTESDSKPIMKELWPKDKIKWRCKCLDTRAKYQNNTVPFIKKKQKISSPSRDNGIFSVPGKEKSSQTD
ncbi:hypothetical protein G6F43_006617 [Rhizopus delemar]|nr:hypothetical protein G6F43_006617 [Rhizopus delemar]